MDDTTHDERRALEAVAFGRASSAEQRDAALTRLRELDERAAVATLAPEPAAVEQEEDAERTERSADRRRRWITVAVIAAAVIAVVVAVIPRPVSSLAVFDRDQTTADRRAARAMDGASPETIASVRALASGESWSGFGYRDPLKRVCLGVVTGGALSLRCVSRPVFQRAGVGITADYADRSGAEREGVFHWGPMGDLHASIGSTPVRSGSNPYPI